MARTKKNSEVENPEDTVEESKELSLDEQRLDLESVLQSLHAQKDEIDRAIHATTKNIDAIIMQQSQKHDPHKTTKDIEQYLASEAKLREEKARIASEMGVRFSSHLTQVYARKSGFGMQRPRY